MKKIQTITLALIVAAGLAAVAFMMPAHAADCSDAAKCINDGLTSTGSTGGSKDLKTVFGQVANVLLFLVAAIGVIVIIIGGIRYVISQGDAKQIESAKNTILYAVIGIIVAILAYAIVQFVIKSFVK